MKWLVYTIFILLLIMADCKKKSDNSVPQDPAPTNTTNEKKFWCIYEAKGTGKVFLECFYGTSEGATSRCIQLRDAGKSVSAEGATDCSKCKK